MATENLVLMGQAQDALKGKWGLAIGVFLVYIIIYCTVEFPMRSFMYGIFSIKFGFAGFIIGGPFTLGLAIFSLALSRKQDAHFAQLFEGFNQFGTAFLAYLLVCIYTVLWLLLLIVPGIIAAISYSQTFYIIAEDKNISPSEAIDKSKKMMDGYKMKYFYLCLRFLVLAILCIFTFGIGFLWLFPYINVTNARFYDDLKEQVVQPVTV